LRFVEEAVRGSRIASRDELTMLERSSMPLAARSELVRVARRRDPSRDATAVVLSLGSAKIGAAS